MKRNVVILLLFVLFAAYSVDTDDFDFIPYQGHYKTIETKRFSILFPTHLNKMARKTAVYAEDIYDHVHDFLQWDPHGKIIIILTDATDTPNGLSYTYPRPTIQLNVVSIEYLDQLRDASDPLYLLLLHEMTHILHLDQIRGGAILWRVLFGRLYFPLVGAFSWFHEGTAVYSESRLAEGGRLDGAYDKAMVQAFAEKRMIPDVERLVYPVVDWPYGDAVYHLGAAFIDYLIEKYGKDRYLLFNQDMSNDFWPFIYEFVGKFKKVYGKSLDVLWDEWRAYEYDLYSQKTEELERPLVEIHGKIGKCSVYKGVLYYSAYTVKEGYGIYKFDHDTIEKIASVYPDDFAFVNDTTIIYTKLTALSGGFSYNEIYLLNLKNGISRKLTYQARAHSLVYSAETNIGCFIKDATVSLFTLHNNKLNIIKSFSIKDFTFVTELAFSPDGKTVVFSGRKTDNDNYRLGILDIITGEQRTVDAVRGKAAIFNGSEKIDFIGKIAGGREEIYEYDLQTGGITQIVIDTGYFAALCRDKDVVYYEKLSAEGYGIYETHEEKVTTEIPRWMELSFSVPEKDPIMQEKEYVPLKYLYPTVWGLIPYQLSSTFTIPGVQLSLPYIAPAFVINNRTPLGRCIYTITTAFDYLTWYPETDAQFIFKLPAMNISYELYTYRQIGTAFNPVGLYQYISPTPVVVFDNYNQLSLPLFCSLNLKQADDKTFALNYSMTGGGGVSYSYARQYPDSAKWNAGFSGSVYAYTTINNGSLTHLIFVSDLETRIPLQGHFFYLATETGYDTFRTYEFSVGISDFSLDQSVISGLGGSSADVDMKGFSTDFGNVYGGYGYGAAEIGFYIQLYRRTHYWHFLTGGFKCLSLRPFAEYTAILNGSMLHLLDTGMELIVDLFGAYGNIDINLVQGHAVGYLIGSSCPVYNGYIGISVGL